MNKTGMLVAAAMLLAGCSTVAGKGSLDSLADRNFVLKSVDGQAVTPPAGMQPGINFSRDMRVTGVMCNRFFGQGKLEKNVLSVPHLASTRMLCIDPRLNEWETTIGEMLTAGAELKLDAQTLTLMGSGHTLVYIAEH